MNQFGIVITGALREGVDVDEFRTRMIKAIEGLMLADEEMDLLGLQFREFPKAKEETDAAPADGSVPGR